MYLEVSSHVGINSQSLGVNAVSQHLSLQVLEQRHLFFSVVIVMGNQGQGKTKKIPSCQVEKVISKRIICTGNTIHSRHRSQIYKSLGNNQMVVFFVFFLRDASAFQFPSLKRQVLNYKKEQPYPSHQESLFRAQQCSTLERRLETLAPTITQPCSNLQASTQINPQCASAQKTQFHHKGWGRNMHRRGGIPFLGSSLQFRVSLMQLSKRSFIFITKHLMPVSSVFVTANILVFFLWRNYFHTLAPSAMEHHHHYPLCSAHMYEKLKANLGQKAHLEIMQSNLML